MPIQQVQQTLEARLACSSHSSWASPIVMVHKKDEMYLLCIDYRALNDHTIKDAYPLPCIQDTLDTLFTAKWFSRPGLRLLASIPATDGPHPSWHAVGDMSGLTGQHHRLGKDILEMLERLGQGFNRLQQSNLKLKPSKCCLFCHQVTYLGHIVSEDGVATNPRKVQKVQDWPTPTLLQGPSIPLPCIVLSEVCERLCLQSKAPPCPNKET